MSMLWDQVVPLVALLAVAVGLGGVIGTATAADEPKKPVVGEPAPDIDLPATLIGKVLCQEVEISALSG